MLQMQVQPNQLTNTLVGATTSIAATGAIRPATTTTIQTTISKPGSFTTKQQPQLLPKPPLTTSVAAAQLQQQPQTVKLSQPQLQQTPATITASSATGPLILNQGNVLTAGQSPLLLNTMGQIVGQASSLGQVLGQTNQISQVVGQAATTLGQVNSLGQVVGQAGSLGQVIGQTSTIVGQATAQAQSQPILIQQPGGNPILVMRPQAPAIQQPVQTILQPTMTAAGTATGVVAAAGQNLFLQPPTPTGAITAQPSVSNLSNLTENSAKLN